MPLFKRGPGPFALHISMASVQMGDRFLQLGCGDGRLFAALASKVGLTGRACAVDKDEAAVGRARAAAAKEGVLVEVERSGFMRLPYDDQSFDVVVIRNILAGMRPDERVPCVQEAWRVLRPGGRVVVMEPAERGGLARLLSRQAKHPDYVSSGGAERALREEGFRSVRKLAEREGVTFVEGARPRRDTLPSLS
jgi:ubiquinone/menaquinone biosynthesis C-methylase UbiE